MGMRSETHVDVGQGLGALLVDINRLLGRAFDRRALVFGLTGAQWRALAYLSRGGPLTQTQLASRLEVSRAAAGNLISRLIRAGYVTRERGLNDQRTWRVRLTARFNEVSEPLAREADALNHDLIAELSPTEVAALRCSLQNLRVQLSRSLQCNSFRNDVR